MLIHHVSVPFGNANVNNNNKKDGKLLKELVESPGSVTSRWIIVFANQTDDGLTQSRSLDTSFLVVKTTHQIRVYVPSSVFSAFVICDIKTW